MKIVLVSLVSLAFTASACLAATFSVEGTITSSTVGSIPMDAIFRFTFDYDVENLGADEEPGLRSTRYSNAFSNATLIIESGLGGTMLYTVGNTMLRADSTIADDYLALEFFAMSPGIGGLTLEYGGLSFYGAPNEAIWPASPALVTAPADPTAYTWSFGQLDLYFSDGVGGDFQVIGDPNLSTFVPETSTSVLLVASSAFGLLRRRRA